MPAPASSGPDWTALQAAISGDVVLPGSPGYDAVRKPAIANFHGVRPRAILRCRTPEDVAEAISFVGRFDLSTAIRSGGHCFAGRSSTEGVLIDVSPMRAVTVEGGTATIGAGARLGEVYDSLAGQGRALPAGCGPTVGIAGLALGGGFGVLGRKHGLTSDQLLAAQVVLADGRIVTCDDRDHADLLWALRGAGALGFGVVTSLVFGTIPAPMATGFHYVWSRRHAAALIEAWQDWAPAAPDELAASLLVIAAADPARPPVANLYGAMLGTEADALNLLDGFVALVGGDPTATDRRQATCRETKRYLAALGDAMAGEDRPDDAPSSDPSTPGALYSKSEFFGRRLPADTIEALLANLEAGRVVGQSRELDFTPCGGAYNRVRADATAFVHRDERFLLQHAATFAAGFEAAEQEAARGWLTKSWALAHPWASGRAYQNWPDPDLADEARAYHGDNLERLRRVKVRYDPDGRFGPHPSSKG